MRSQVWKLPPGEDLQVYRAPAGNDLVGQTLRIRAAAGGFSITASWPSREHCWEAIWSETVAGA
jgi:hypothetical protein